MITVSAAIIRDSAGRVLTVRKQGTSAFMFPGGKWEEGETTVRALEREVYEELGITLAHVAEFGVFRTAAANETGEELTAHVFTAIAPTLPTAASSEIAELRWVWPSLSQDVQLAPLLQQAVFPLLSAAISSVTVYCGSAMGNSPGFASRARSLGAELAANNISLVYGGGRVGLMGEIADAVLADGGTAIGIIPKQLKDLEIAHVGLTELQVVANMHERKEQMAVRGDAFVAMPGGAGTLEELFEAWTWQMLGIHEKPVALYGRDFWAPLLAMLQSMAEQGFIAQRFVDSLIVADNPAELLQRLHAWVPPRAKWD